MGKDYDYTVKTDEDGRFDIPDEIKNEGGSITVRQPQSTTVYRKESMAFYQKENPHLDATLTYFEVEVKIWGEDKTYLIKAEFPDEMSDELKTKIQTNLTGDTNQQTL